MDRFRKYLLLISAVVLLSFVSVLLAETFHHHGELETEDNCAFCSFQLTGSQAPSTPAPPPLLPVMLLFFILFFLQPILVTFNFISPSGRSPPSIPL
jgi:hypothetical protein